QRHHHLLHLVSNLFYIPYFSLLSKFHAPRQCKTSEKPKEIYFFFVFPECSLCIAPLYTFRLENFSPREKSMNKFDKTPAENRAKSTKRSPEAKFAKYEELCATY
ncbi:MAG: hypothetical protein J6O49_22290, partial [Bacteroidaceae bacterium]|nr:hypothetical protein [Bacteroidaceae bacterium]